MMGEGETGRRRWMRGGRERTEQKEKWRERGLRGREGVKERKKRRKHKGEGKEIIVLERRSTHEHKTSRQCSRAHQKTARGDSNTHEVSMEALVVSIIAGN